MATERIDIIVSERGSRTVRRNIEDIGGSAASAEGAVTLLRRALGLLGGAAVAQQLARIADSYTNLQNRLKLVTTGTQNLTRVTNELFGVSNRTRSSFEGTAELYARVALSAKDLGVGQEELLHFTESLNQAVILSGASMREAEGAIIQLSQGLASGTLQGDEMRSVLEQLPMVADVIAKHMGVTRGELREMGKTGQVTSQIILEAFRDARVELGEKFAQTVPTIGQSLQVLKNKFMELWGQFVTGSGLAQALAGALLFVANHLNQIIPLVLAVGAAFAGWAITSSIMAVLGPMIALERALGATSVASALFSVSMKAAQGAVRGLTVAIAANPIGAILVAITTAIALFVAFGDEIKVTSDGAVSLKDAFVAAGQIIMESISGVTAFLQTAWDTAMSAVNSLFSVFGTTVSEVFSFIMSIVKGAINAYIGMWVLAFRAVKLAWNNFPGYMDALFTTIVNIAASAAELVLNAWQAPLRLIAKGLGYVNEEAAAGLNSFLDNFNVSIPRRRASAAGQAFARDFGQAAQDAFTTDYLGNFADSVIARARRNNANEGAQGGLNGAGAGRTPRAGAGAGGPGGSSGNDAAAANTAFQDYLNNLDREIALLGMGTREREKAQALWQLEDQMKRQLTATERELASAKYDEFRAAKDADTINKAVTNLQQENELLRANRQEREALAKIRQLEAELGRPLTDAEAERIRTLVQENEALKVQAQVLQEIKGPQEDLLAKQDALNALYESGKISTDEYTRAMRDLAVQLTATNNTLEGGLENGMARIAQRANDLAKSISDAVVGMADKLEDQLVNFAKTGKFSFKDLADFAIEQIIRITTQQALAQLFGGGGGGGGGFGSGGLGGVIMSLFGGGGFANGGGFTVPGSGTTDSKLVAFRATPGETVNVSHPGKPMSHVGGSGGDNYHINVNVGNPGDEMQARRSGKAMAREIGRALQRVGSDLPR